MAILCIIRALNNHQLWIFKVWSLRRTFLIYSQYKMAIATNGKMQKMITSSTNTTIILVSVSGAVCGSNGQSEAQYSTTIMLLLISSLSSSLSSSATSFINVTKNKKTISKMDRARLNTRRPQQGYR